MNIIWLQITSLVYMTILLILYFSAKRIKSEETAIFKRIMIVNEIGLIIELLCFYTAAHINQIPVMNTIMTHLLLVYYVVYILLFTIYLFFIAKKDLPSNKYKRNVIYFCLAYFIINVLMIMLLPMYYHTNDNVFYSYGPSVNFLFGSYSFLIIIWCCCITVNLKNLRKKKMLPVILLIVLGTIVGIIQKIHPDLLLMTSADTIVTFLMYFTIENPDIKMINELNLAKERADKANHAKTDFLSSMSHEIRTPLNAIVGFSQSLKEEDIPASAKEEVDDIVSASETLLEIVNGILDISKIEANKLEIIDKEYDVNQIFKELINLTKVRIGDKPIELKVNIDPTIPPVLYGDHVRVKQVILNLLTNAAKYTEKGTIEFNVQSVKHDNMCRLIISVKDTGRGIKQEDMDKLFAKFERLEEKNTTIEGTGLGLAITKMLLNLMGGNIVVQSKYQEGSNFIISIDQGIVANPTINKEKENEEVSTTPTTFSDKKIMIVDDNKLNLKVAARLLQAYNMQLDLVESGNEAIDKIKQNNMYDLILLDDMMPDKSGTETLNELRGIPNFNIPVVVLTANAIEGMKEEYLEKGFDDYLAKPISKEELRRVLLKYLN